MYSIYKQKSVWYTWIIYIKSICNNYHVQQAQPTYVICQLPGVDHENRGQLWVDAGNQDESALRNKAPGESQDLRLSYGRMGGH